jgi:hypothetical protein
MTPRIRSEPTVGRLLGFAVDPWFPALGLRPGRRQDHLRSCQWKFVSTQTFRILMDLWTRADGRPLQDCGSVMFRLISDLLRLDQPLV